MNSCFDSFSTIGAKAKKARALVLNIGSQNTVDTSSSYFTTLFYTLCINADELAVLNTVYGPVSNSITNQAQSRVAHVRRHSSNLSIASFGNGYFKP